MALMPRQEDIDHVGDITAKLPSLQFESALSDAELQCLHLRKITQAQTATACAQAIYFVSVMNEARQIREQLKNPKHRRTSRLLQESGPNDPLLIGIIGCGRLGTHIAHSLLTFGEVNPEELKISTRRPETLSELQEKGVMCVNNNKLVTASVHLLFLCVLPSQFPAVAEEIKSSISIRCTIYSLMSSTSMGRLKQLLEVSNIIRPEYSWDNASSNNLWDYTMDLPSIFADSRMLELTCPLSFHKKDSVVRTDEGFAEQMIFAFINMCSMLRLNINETMNVLHAVIFGETTDEPLSEKLESHDIILDIPDNFTNFPKMDLVSLSLRDTPLKDKICHSKGLRRRFVDRYLSVFSQYLQWRQFASEQSK